MKAKPTLHAEDIARVKFALADGRWMKGCEILARFGIPTRQVRAVAEVTGDVISGQQGCKLARFATTAEIRQSIADLESRARHMMKRADLHRAHLSWEHRGHTLGQSGGEELLL